MKVTLRNLANCEEAYFTDSNSYGTIAKITASCPEPQLTGGTIITLHLAGASGYCFAGKVGAGRFWIYDSTSGGIRGPATSDTCNASVFTEAGGTLIG